MGSLFSRIRSSVLVVTREDELLISSLIAQEKELFRFFVVRCLISQPLVASTRSPRHCDLRPMEKARHGIVASMQRYFDQLKERWQPSIRDTNS